MWLDPEAHPVSLDTHLWLYLHPPQGGSHFMQGLKVPGSPFSAWAIAVPRWL